jgi:hypothetical protein
MFPWFDVLDSPAKRMRSKADDERASRIAYHRRSRNSRSEPCADCITDGVRPKPAVYGRKQGSEEVLLCFEHKQTRQDRERLNGGPK